MKSVLSEGKAARTPIEHGIVRRRAGRPPAGGFTLLEIVIAVAVVSMGLAAAFTTVNRVAFNAAFLRDKTLANWVALNKIAELRLEPAMPGTGEGSGELDYAGQTFRWETNVSETGVENLRRVDVTVRYADEARQLISVAGFLGPRSDATSTPTPWSGSSAPETGERESGARTKPQ